MTILSYGTSFVFGSRQKITERKTQTRLVNF